MNNIVIFSLIGNRVEDFLMDKIDRRRLARLSNLDYLGVNMVESGNDLGPGTLYGNVWSSMQYVKGIVKITK